MVNQRLPVCWTLYGRSIRDHSAAHLLELLVLSSPSFSLVPLYLVTVDADMADDARQAPDLCHLVALAVAGVATALFLPPLLPLLVA